MPWLDAEPMSEKMLQDISVGNYQSLIGIATRKNIRLTTDELYAITSCLGETYQDVHAQSLRQQEGLETAGSISIYNDGNRENSDYDIIDDIKKIHTILFSDPPKYDGKINPTGKSLSRFLAGDPAPILMNPPTNTGGTDTPPGGGDGGGGGSTPPGGGGGTDGRTPTAPWATVCSTDTPTQVSNMVNGDFLTDLEQVLQGGNPIANHGYDYSDRTGRSGTTGSGNAEETAEKDYFHKPKCDGFFCITVTMAGGSEKLLG